MVKLEVLVGMIASGKSTYCRKRAMSGAIVVNDDAIITALHGGNYTYHRPLRPGYKTVQVMLARTFLLMGRDVIIDSTNLSARTRRKWISLAKEHDASPVAVVFPRMSATVHAKRRFDADARGCSAATWAEVAKAHDAEYEKVSEEEGFDEIFHPIFA